MREKINSASKFLTKFLKSDNTPTRLLEERGKVYGDYQGGTELRAAIMEIIEDRYLLTNNETMPRVICIFDIVNKLSRLAVTPTHVDSWRDISGYSTLTSDLLEQEKNNAS